MLKKFGIYFLNMARNRISELPQETVSKIEALKIAGHSHRAIAMRVGLSHGSVQRILAAEKGGLPAAPRKTMLPKKPRKTMPDFRVIADAMRHGAALSDCWKSYARNAAVIGGAYSYEHFSTLFKRFQNEASSVTHADNPCALTDADLIDIEASRAHWLKQISPKAETLILTEYGVNVSVRSGSLCIARAGKEHRFPMVTHGLRAVMLQWGSASITTDALKWLEAQSVSLFMLTWDGDLRTVIHATPSSNVAIRRKQFSADRLTVSRWFLRGKLCSCTRIAKSFDAMPWIDRLERAETVAELVMIEAHAALEYWACWRMPLRHRKQDWPAPWSSFDQRASLLSGGPRHATHPVNAILNLAYSCIASQIARTLAASNLDPAAGFLHADADGRFSLAYDLIELLRADIDAAILPWVSATTWRKGDFITASTGVVRLRPELAAVISERALSAIPQRAIDATIEEFIDVLRKV